MTRLLVDGKEKQTLPVMTLYTFDAAHPHQYEKKLSFEPTVYQTGASMRYTRTLVFPLEQAGQFKSKITDLKVYNYIK